MGRSSSFAVRRDLAETAEGRERSFRLVFSHGLRDAVIAFDLDGTLVDSAPDLIGALNRMLVEEGLAPFPTSAARRLLGGGARKLVERGFAEAGRPFAQGAPEALVDHFISLYAARIADESRAYPGVAETLDALRAEGAELIVCTNKRTDLSKALLEAVGLIDRFTEIVGSDRVSARKPDPAHVAEAIALAGGALGRALMVGDSDNDVRSARGAGVPVAVVSFGYTETPARDLGADAVIDRFHELPQVARDLLARFA
jgi:phosphoglycolate phosphatase